MKKFEGIHSLCCDTSAAVDDILIIYPLLAFFFLFAYFDVFIINDLKLPKGVPSFHIGKSMGTFNVATSWKLPFPVIPSLAVPSFLSVTLISRMSHILKQSCDFSVPFSLVIHFFASVFYFLANLFNFLCFQGVN